jgi:outer membrane protein assembly factor BamD (BamD/ComL family)
MPITTKRNGNIAWMGLILSLWVLFMGTAWGASVDPDQQEILALEYRLSIDRTPASDAAERERLFLRIIEECPETEAAEEAHWALSNLYLDDFDEPREDKAREILESFLKRYPSSQWVLHVESRLAWLQGKE